MSAAKASPDSAYMSFSLAHNPSIALIQDHIRRIVGDQAEYQDPATYHITAVYVDSISDHDLQEVLEWTKDDRWLIPSEGHTFTITASRLGVFENGDERALHIVVDPSPDLLAQQAALYDRFVEAGYQSALSPFSNPSQYRPHITLAYLKPGAPVPQVDFELTCKVQALVFGRTDYEVFGVTHAKEQEGTPAMSKIDRKIKLLEEINRNYAELDKLDSEAPEAEAESESESEQPEGKKMLWKPSQSEVNYTPLSPDQAQLCGGCRWFNGNRYADEPACHLIDNWPVDIVATGRCDRWEAIPNPEPEPMPVTIVGGEQKSLRQRLADTFKNFLTKEQVSTGFKAYGDYWLAAWSNNFKDRDGEFFPEKAIDDYIWRVDNGLVPMPELWDSHIPGTRSGQADMVFRIGHFAMAVGTFDDTPLGQAAKAYHNARRNKPEGVSHGFLFDPAQKQDKAYWQFNTFEISPLGAFDKAANPFAAFEGVKSMTLTEDKKKRLIEKFGEEQARSIISDYEQKSKELDELRVEYKEFVAPDGGETEAVKEAAANADKTLTELVPELVAGQAEAVNAALNAVKLAKELRGLVDAQNKQIDALRAELALSPRASQADETAVTDTKLLKNLEEKEKDSVGFDPFPGVNRGQ